MALSLKDQFQIKTVPAYQSADGKRFHEIAEAQGYTRDMMLESTIALACRENPQFARLDKPVLKEFLLHAGVVIGKIMAEPLTPVGAYQKMEPSQVKVENNVHVNTEGTSAKISELSKPRDYPEVPMHVAAAEHREASKRWGDHPLKSAMKAVDDGEMERQVEDDIAAALKIGGH